MKGKAYDCFAFEKKILEYGYPRTDILFNADEKQIKNIKKSLGIPLDKKVILYTPTWRKKGAFDMQLDLEKMKAVDDIEINTIPDLLRAVDTSEFF